MKGLDWSAHSPEPQPRPTPFGWGRSADSEPEFSFRPHISAARHINIWWTDSNQSNVWEWSGVYILFLKQHRLFCPCMVFVFIGSVRFSAHVKSLWKLQMQSDKQRRETAATSTAAATDGRLLQQWLDSISSTDLSSCSAQKKKKQKTSQILVPVALLWHENKQRNTSVSVRRPSMIF